MTDLPVIDGPYDGAVLTGLFQTAMVFIKGPGDMFEAPEPDTFAYWVHGDALRFAGHGFHVCDGCGAWVGAPIACPLCGAA